MNFKIKKLNVNYKDNFGTYDNIEIMEIMKN